MNTPIMGEFKQDFKELRAFQQAIELVGLHGKLEDLDQKWQDLVKKAEQQLPELFK